MKHTKPVKQPKVDAVSTLESTMKNASSITFIDYKTLGMKESQALKKKLSEGKGTMFVAKNTLFKIAGKNAGLPEEVLSDTVLSGQTAMVVGTEDPVSPIQALGKFMADTDKTNWKAGVVEGQFQDAQGMARISKLPGKDQLVAQIIGGISSPLYGLLSTLNGNIQKLVYILQAKAQVK